jgi:ribosomal protein S18 acetylase RimI-like enzyme
MNVTIRPAHETDLPEAVAMAARFYATTAYTGIADFNPDSAEKLGRLLLDQGVLLVAERDDKLVGVIGLVIAPFPFNETRKTAHEVLWWVEPEHRDSGAGVELLREMVQACQYRGATAIQMLCLATSPPQAAALYERMGFIHSESSYLKVL